MVDQVRRRPELADAVVMTKKGIEGTSKVSRQAFEKVWQPRGWELFKPDAPATDETAPVSEPGPGAAEPAAVEAAAAEPAVDDTAARRRKPAAPAATTSEES